MRVQLLVGAFLCVFLASCGGGYPSCDVTGITVRPATATADHSAAFPGNTAQFFVDSVVPGMCSTVLLRPNWSVSDAVNVSISSASDMTNGTATCLNTTAAPATVTATATVSGKTFMATGTLTCN